LVALLLTPVAVPALDLFTLWRQPMIPVHMIEGAWVDYRSVTTTGGKQVEDLVRVQCVGAAGSAAGTGWLVEILPLVETADGIRPRPGEGLQLEISRRLLRREGELTAIVEKVVRWADGQARELATEEWRSDPLVTSSLSAEFEPDSAELISNSIRVVAGREIRCDHFQLTAADTQRVVLPRGVMTQETLWEITAAVNAEIPFFGIVFAAERTRSASRLEPPSKRFSLPPPTARVETMELIAFGNGAHPALTVR